MDVEAGFVFGASVGILTSAFCWLSSLDEETRLKVEVNSRRRKQSSSNSRLKRKPTPCIVGIKELLYCCSSSESKGIWSRRVSPLCDRERMDLLCEVKEQKMMDEATICQLREICVQEREQRIFFEQSAYAEKGLRRECEEQIAIYSAECSRLKEIVLKNQLSLTEKNLVIEDLQTKLAALESILKLLSPEANPSQSASAATSPSVALQQESVSAISEERDFLRQENEELRSKLLEERKRAREEKDRLERQIAQYNLFLMMGANNATGSVNSPSASPTPRSGTSKLDGSSNFVELPVQSLSDRMSET